jgi:hypothetical protein
VASNAFGNFRCDGTAKELAAKQKTLGGIVQKQSSATGSQKPASEPYLEAVPPKLPVHSPLLHAPLSTREK